MTSNEIPTSRLITEDVFMSPASSEELINLLVSMALTVGYVYISFISKILLPEDGVGSKPIPPPWYYSPFQVCVMFR